MSRVIFVKLNHGFIFKNLEDVQNELKNIVLALVPPVCNTAKIPFMTNGDIGERALIYANDRIIVEDVKEGDYFIRQMLFLSNVNQIQSEIRLEISDNNELYNENSIVPYPIKANYQFLTFECQRSMLLTLGFYSEFVLNNVFTVLILGAGACVFPTFLLKHFPNIKITAVDIDPEVVNIGQRFFGVLENLNFNIVIEDAKNFVSNCSEPVFDYIFLDICIGDPTIATPPPEFTNPSFLSGLHKILKTQGILSINMIGNEFQIRGIISEVREVFKNIYKCKCKNDTNITLFCLKDYFEVDWKMIVKGIKSIEDEKKWDKTMALVEYAGWVSPVEDPKDPQSILPKPKKNRKKKKKN